MAPARHETSGAGSPGTPDKTSTYGTRASKRKVSEVSTNGTNDSATKRSSGRSTRKTAAVANDTFDDSEPPAKRRWAFNPNKDEPHTTPSPDPETPEERKNENSEDEAAKEQSVESTASDSAVPGIIVDGPVEEEASSPDSNPDEENLISETPATWDDLPATEEANGEENAEVASTPAKRGRGGFRGGRRKRGGAKVKAKPKPVVKPAPLPTLRGRGRRRGGRRKASVNPRIDALNNRAGELKAQYTFLARLQKHALEVLAERSLDMVKEDPTYHESLPEYSEVTGEIDRLYRKRLDEIRTLQEAEEALLKKSFEREEQVIQAQLYERCEIADEAAIARAKEHAMYVWHQAMRNDKLDEFPCPETSETDHAKIFGVTKVFVPKMLHPFATPYTRPQEAVQAPSTEGDTPYLQHPNNLWRSLTVKGKANLLKERDAQHRKKVEAAIEEEKNQGGKKRKREALFQPMQTHVTVPGDDDEEDEEPEEEPEEETSTSPAKKSKVTASEPAEDEYFSSDAEEYPEDEYGVWVPKKKHRGKKAANNRIRYQPTFQFEDYEIGLRQHYFRTKQKQEIAKAPNDPVQFVFLGIDATPNREHFYFEQRANGWNTANMKPEDFNQDIVKAHGLHPRFAIPLPTSKNVERDELENPYFSGPTNWNEDLPIPRSQRVIESFADGQRKFFHSSRNWVQEISDKWEAHGSRMNMFQLLQASDDHEVLFPGVPREDLRRMDFLAMACTEQEKKDAEKEAADRAQAKIDNANRLAKEAEERDAAKAARAIANAAPIPSLGAPRLASTSRYDPVRDTTYQTPYPQAVPPPRPAQHNVYRQGGPLSALADMADFGTANPSLADISRQRQQFYPNAAPTSNPRAGPPRGSWVEPQPLPAELPPPHLMQHGMGPTGLSHVHPPPPPPPQMSIPQQMNTPQQQQMPAPPQQQMSGPPPPMTGPQQMGLSPNNYFMPPHPPQPPPFQSPRSNANQGNLRPLQPAPPRGGRRTTPPQPQNRGWYATSTQNQNQNQQNYQQ